MDKKVERTFARLELADYLATLSEQLRRRRLEAQGRTWPVPEEVGVKFHLKEEEGCLVGKLSWRWSLKGDRQVVPEAKRAPAAPGAEVSFKAVKAGLAAGFKEIRRLAGQGLFPDEQMLNEFGENSRRLAAMASPEWRQAMEDYLAHLENLEGAVSRRDLPATRHELENLQNSMAACHREFK